MANEKKSRNKIYEKKKIHFWIQNTDARLKDEKKNRATGSTHMHIQNRTLMFKIRSELLLGKIFPKKKKILEQANIEEAKLRSLRASFELLPLCSRWTYILVHSLPERMVFDYLLRSASVAKGQISVEIYT